MRNTADIRQRGKDHLVPSWRHVARLDIKRTRLTQSYKSL